MRLRIFKQENFIYDPMPSNLYKLQCDNYYSFFNIELTTKKKKQRNGQKKKREKKLTII